MTKLNIPEPCNADSDEENMDEDIMEFSVHDEVEKEYDELYQGYKNYTKKDLLNLLKKANIIYSPNNNKQMLIERLIHFKSTLYHRNQFKEYDTEKFQKFNGKSPSEIFLIFFEEIIDIIVIETNRYIEQENNQELRDTHFPLGITQEVIRVFLTAILLIGSINPSRLESYWDYGLYYTSSVSSLLTYTQFRFLLTHLHFANNQDQNLVESDKLYKITNIMNICKKKFQENWSPHQNIAIDEGIVPSENTAGLKEYIQDKPGRWGYKFWKLVDEKGYLYFFDLYAGKNSVTKEGTDKIWETIVKKLLKESKVLGHNHIIYTDNFFTTIPVSEFLLQNNTHCIGTIRNLKRAIPQELFNDQLVKGDYRYLVLQDSTISLLRINDTKEFLLLNTKFTPNEGVPYHSQSQQRRGVQKYRFPKALESYRSYMGCVNRHDKRLKNTSFYQVSNKWYLSIFWFLLESTVINSFLVYNRTNIKDLKFADFRTKLILELPNGITLRKNKENPVLPFSNLKKINKRKNHPEE
ncbi:hypothetical protein DLAC_08129 [Tieghemostelium lacteum]|uniref:PiggyBac transposable element-derived protein domain-containing protein n=1 Tax=Tieghemostelium lacteum TaxID=361077 RepID=A0A151ZB92_TIELA|nr:hypothetical protein DLAC_08129 [Tieghemostelium lacteum]|eukprot:KYQ91206.1 hypothetical protein DLAC_08129 [Tieghemostelium lacteum]